MEVNKIEPDRESVIHVDGVQIDPSIPKALRDRIIQENVAIANANTTKPISVSTNENGVISIESATKEPGTVGLGAVVTKHYSRDDV
jgi:hypothetical protein